jgi:CHASE2 domain-containing sensor protein
MSDSRKPASLEIRPWRTPGGLFALLAPGLVWLLSLAGLLDVVTGAAYDRLMRLSARWPRESPRVVLVELDPQRGVGEPAYRHALDTLESLGARKTVFAFLPSDVSPAFYADAVRRGVVFGWPVVPDTDDPDQLRLAERPPGTEVPDGSFGLVAAPPGSDAVHRHAHVRLSVGQRRHLALEMAAAASLGAPVPPATVESYLVSFSGGPGSLPAAPLERLLSGGLVSELVQGRTALVGPALGAAQPGLHTPTTSGSQTMSPLEFQGHALDTLLSGRIPRKAGPLAALLLLTAFTLPTLLLYQRLEVRLASWLTLGLLALHGLLAALLFVSLRFFLPVVELMLAQGLLFVLALRGKALLTSQAIDTLLQHLSARLRERLWPTSFYLSPEHWSQVINMVNQTLDLSRVIFLERVEADHRVREIKALNCSLEDIDEKRRDYERTPYSTAIEAQRPIQVKGYLKRVESNEEQYLAPLAFAGEILGFWAFGVEPAKAAAIPQFEAVVRDFGDQIGELLYHRQRVLKEQASGSPLLRLMRLQRELELYRALSRTMALVERRLGRVESLLDDLSTAAIMYDLFGRVLEANSRMLELLRAEGLAPYNMTALDLVAALTGQGPAQCRGVLRQVIVEKAAVSLPVALAGGRSFALSLRALEASERLGDLEEAAPFQLTGILCELVDTSSLTRLYDVKAHLMQRLGVQLRSDLAALERPASQLATGELPEHERRDAAARLHERVVAALATVDECQQYLGRDSDAADSQRFPIDPCSPLERALEDLQPSAQARGLTFERLHPKVLSPVFASPTRLQDVFGSVLGHLAEDALGGTPMRIQVEEDAGWVTFSFGNRGFGMPNDRFQAWLFSDQNGGSDAARKLRVALRWVQDWGGAVEAESEVGSGTRIRLRFQRFSLTPHATGVATQER